MLKLDSDGAVVWTETYDSGEGDDTAVKVRTTLDGGFIVAGYAPPGLYVVRVDKDGNELGALVHPIEHVYGTHQILQTFIEDLHVVSEGVYLLVGYKQTQDFDEGGPPSDIYVLKLAEGESANHNVPRTTAE